jgi:hypothetical protein
MWEWVSWLQTLELEPISEPEGDEWDHDLATIRTYIPSIFLNSGKNGEKLCFLLVKCIWLFMLKIKGLLLVVTIIFNCWKFFYHSSLVSIGYSHLQVSIEVTNLSIFRNSAQICLRVPSFNFSVDTHFFLYLKLIE